MGFLKRLLGGGEKPEKEYVDTRGVYFYVRCDRCGMCTRLRADKEYDLVQTGDGYVWHKTIVDSRCFRPMPTVVNLDASFTVTSAEISGGEYITREAYESWLEKQARATADEEE